MHTSIQRFVAFGTYNLQKAIEKFISHPEDIASFVNDVQQEVLKFGLDIISEGTVNSFAQISSDILAEV